MTRRRVAGSFACALVLAGATRALAAGEGAGTAAASFLSIGSGASVLSMAGATLASGNDLATVAWNPAALARVQGLQFALTHLPLPGGATQDWLAAGGPLGGSALGWGLQSVFHRETGIEGRDASNNPTSALSATDLAVSGQLAIPLGGAAEAGLTAEWVNESLAGETGSGLGFGLGLRGRVGPLGLGIAGRHLGGGVNHGGTRYDLPGVVAAGLSWSDDPRGLRVAVDLESPAHYYRALRVGGEWRWREQVAFRGGDRMEVGAPAGDALNGATFGIGTGMAGWWLDYGFAPGGGDATGAHRVGLTFRPGGPGRDVTARALALPRSAAAPAIAPARRVGSPPPVRSAPAPVATTPAARPVAEPTATKPSAAPASEARAEKPATKSAVPVAVVAPAVPAASLPASSAKASEPPARPSIIIVAPGETLADIARRWGTTVAALMMTNDLVNERVKPGQTLRLPPTSRR